LYGFRQAWFCRNQDNVYGKDTPAAPSVTTTASATSIAAVTAATTGVAGARLLRLIRWRDDGDSKTTMRRSFADLQFFAHEAVATQLGVPKNILPLQIAQTLSNYQLGTQLGLKQLTPQLWLKSVTTYTSWLDSPATATLVLSYLSSQASELRKTDLIDLCNRACIPTSDSKQPMQRPRDCYFPSSTLPAGLAQVQLPIIMDDLYAPPTALGAPTLQRTTSDEAALAIASTIISSSLLGRSGDGSETKSLNSSRTMAAGDAHAIPTVAHSFLKRLGVKATPGIAALFAKGLYLGGGDMRQRLRTIIDGMKQSDLEEKMMLKSSRFVLGRPWYQYMAMRQPNSVVPPGGWPAPVACLASELVFTAAARELDQPTMMVMDWPTDGVEITYGSEEGQFLSAYGMMEAPPCQVVLQMAAAAGMAAIGNNISRVTVPVSAPVPWPVISLPLLFFIKNFTKYYGGYQANRQLQTIPFLPVHRRLPIVVAPVVAIGTLVTPSVSSVTPPREVPLPPTEVVFEFSMASPSSCVTRANPFFPVLQNPVFDLCRQHQVAVIETLGCFEHMPMAMTVDQLIKNPPTTVPLARQYFEYMKLRLDGNEGLPTADQMRLREARIIPTVVMGIATRLAPREVCLIEDAKAPIPLTSSGGPGGHDMDTEEVRKLTLVDLIDFVDFGIQANAFLRSHLGCQNWPSPNMLVEKMLTKNAMYLSKHPAQRYLELLRWLYPRYHQISTSIREQLTSRPWLLAVRPLGKQVAPPGTSAAAPVPELKIPLKILPANQIFLVDSTHLDRLLQPYIAPADLQKFYQKFGSRYLNECVRPQLEPKGKRFTSERAAIFQV
jgi:hypothetical protein